MSEQGLTRIDTKFDTTYSYSVDVETRVIFREFHVRMCYDFQQNFLEEKYPFSEGARASSRAAAPDVEAIFYAGWCAELK